jgi:hypothetical protein
VAACLRKSVPLRAKAGGHPSPHAVLAYKWIPYPVLVLNGERREFGEITVRVIRDPC